MNRSEKQSHPLPVDWGRSNQEQEAIWPSTLSEPLAMPSPVSAPENKPPLPTVSELEGQQTEHSARQVCRRHKCAADRITDFRWGGEQKLSIFKAQIPTAQNPVMSRI